MTGTKEDIPERSDGLQVDERKTLQHRIWLFQRASWVVMLIVVACAIAGLTGDGGMVAERSVTLDTGTVTGPRILRQRAGERITVTFVGGSQTHRLALDADFFGQFDIEAVSPPPQTTHLSDDRQLMEFAADGAGPHIVTLRIRPHEWGRADFAIDLNGRSLRWQALVLP